MPMILRALLCLLLLGHAASADDDSAKPWAQNVSEDAQKLALELFEQGNVEFVELRYPQALAKYREALKHWDHPSIRFNIAVCLIHLDQPLEAKDNLERAMQYGAAPIGDDLHQQGVTYRKLLASQLTHVKISCREPGAVVTLDGRLLFDAPGERELDLLPGGHQIVATKTGFLTAMETLDLRAGQSVSHDVRLVAFKAAVLTRNERRWEQWKPWAVVGAGALLAGTGAILYGVASSNFDEYDSTIGVRCPSGCDAQMSNALGLPALHDRASLQESLSYVMFGLGGAVIGVGLTGVVMNQERTVVVRGTF